MSIMSDPVTTSSELHVMLRELHQRAGSPSVREISRRTHNELSHSTVHVVLRGEKASTWYALVHVVRALGGNPVEFKNAWTYARTGVTAVSSHDNREFRVTGNAGSKYAVAELTVDVGLVPLIDGIERWQALAITAILDHPFDE